MRYSINSNAYLVESVYYYTGNGQTDVIVGISVNNKIYRANFIGNTDTLNNGEFCYYHIESESTENELIEMFGNGLVHKYINSEDIKTHIAIKLNNLFVVQHHNKCLASPTPF